jgi:hypothetical protein
MRKLLNNSFLDLIAPLLLTCYENLWLQIMFFLLSVKHLYKYLALIALFLSKGTYHEQQVRQEKEDHDDKSIDPQVNQKDYGGN